MHADRMKRIPVWALDDEKIKTFIEYRFPKAKTDPRQRRLAARMVRLIYLYYRAGETNIKIAGELKMSLNAVDCALHRINKAMGRPLKRVGRPKKNHDSIEPSYEASL